jgi:hypothetical protein
VLLGWGHILQLGGGLATTPRTTSTQPQHSSPHYILTLIHTVSTHQHHSTPHHIPTFISKVHTSTPQHPTPYPQYSIYPPYKQYPHIHATRPHTESTQLFIPLSHIHIQSINTSLFNIPNPHICVHSIHTSRLQLPVTYPHIHTANHAPMPMTVCTLACGK